MSGIASEPRLRTVRGDVPASEVGSVNYHEHLFQISPLLPGDELTDERASQAEAELLRRAGTSLMVEATPLGLGGRPAAVARVSAATGLHIIHATGRHHGGHYSPDSPWRDWSEEELAHRFVRDIVAGMVDEDRPEPAAGGEDPPASADAPAPRAGVLKAAARYWAIGSFERKTFAAVAAAHASTGAAVMVHLDHGSAAHESLDLLETGGVAPTRVVLAHMDRNLDPGLHADLAARGAFLGYDGWARHRVAPDAAILDCVEAVVAAGAGDRIVLGGDVARASRYLSYGGMPGLAYLDARVLPRIRARLGDEVARLLTRDNAVALFALPAADD